MKRMIIVIFLCLSIIPSFGISTKYINELKFDKLDNFEFSNISFVENKGVELSKDNSVFYQSKEPIWSIESWKDGFLASSGNSARLSFINAKEQKILFEDSNFLFFSDIKQIGNRFYLPAIPGGNIFILDRNYKLDNKISVSNQYIWELIHYGKGFIALCGNPAEVYYFNSSDKIAWSAQIENEDNIIKGMIISNALYFFGDGTTLYRMPLSGDIKPNVSATASFDNAISDFIFYNGKIYLITTTPDTGRNLSAQGSSARTDSESQNKNSASENKSSRMKGLSSLYEYDLNGGISTLFEKSNIRFLSLTALNDRILIGCDKNASYFEISLINQEKRFTGLGRGKLANFINNASGNFAVLLEPSRIIKLEDSYSKEGYLQSIPYDTGNVSSFGTPFIEINPASGNSCKVFTRTSAVAYDSFWEDWLPADGKVLSSPNRFIEYRIEINSSGKYSPSLQELRIPYIQNNIAPQIDKISITDTAPTIQFNWEASDENKDIITYELYLSHDGNNFFRLTEKPIEENTYELSRDKLPQGRYFLKIVARDDLSNPTGKGKTSYKVSDSFTIDSEPPSIGNLEVKNSGDKFTIQFSAEDNLSPIREAAYSINGKKWINILPEDGIFDSKKESFAISLTITNFPATVAVKVEDTYGNYRTKATYLK